MNKKLDIHNFWRSNIFIILVFAVASVLSSIIMIHYKFVLVGSDMFFHWQRIYELRDSILNGNIFDMVAVNKFNQTGTAAMSLYPKFNLLPITLLSLVVSNIIKLYYIDFILRNFVSLLIAYFASYCFNKNKKVSSLFAISYVLSTMVLNSAVLNYDIGMSSAMIFLPLVLFGFFELICKNHWIEISLGISAIIMSHVLSAIIAIIFIILLFVFNIKTILKRNVLFAATKAFILTVLISSAFWIPFLILSVSNHISMPPAPATISGVDFNSLISDIFNNNVSTSITITAFIGLVLGIINYSKLTLLSQQIFWISILFLVVCSNFFPWNILSDTFIKATLQFTFRFYIIPQMLLCYVFAECSIKLCNNYKKNIIVFVGIVCGIICIQMVGQKQIVANNIHNPELFKPYSGEYHIVIKSKKEINNLVNGWRPGLIDYYPKNSVSKYDVINNHFATYGNRKNIRLGLLGNGKFIFTNKKFIKKLSLPFLYYHGIDYQVKLDGKTVKGYPNKNALMTINNVHKGKHHVQIIVHKTKAEIASYILSLIGLLILLGTILKNFLKKHKIA